MVVMRIIFCFSIEFVSINYLFPTVLAPELPNVSYERSDVWQRELRDVKFK